MAEIKEIDGIYLYTIDDLGKVIENNYKIRRQALTQAEKIIDYKIIEFSKFKSDIQTKESNISATLLKIQESEKSIDDSLILNTKNGKIKIIN